MKASASGLLTSSSRRGVSTESATSGYICWNSPIWVHRNIEAKPGGHEMAKEPPTPAPLFCVPASPSTVSALRTSDA